MINYIKLRIKYIVNQIVEKIIVRQRSTQQANFDYHQISQLFKEESFIPFSAWAISPSTILHVLNDITINKRKNILEFGAGASTFYIAKLIETLKLEAKFYTVESNAEWAVELERQLELYHLEKIVTVIVAPIVKVPQDLSYKNQETWYDIEKIKNEVKNIAFDLILVDGPFGGSTSYARYSAVPFLQNQISDDFSIFLDDINRNDEKEIVKEWQKNLNCNLSFCERHAVLTTSKGFDITPFQLV